MMEQQKRSNLKFKPHSNPHHYSSLDIEYEDDIAWYYMKSQPRPCFTPALTYEIQDWYDSLKGGEIRYIVGGSKVPGIFNLGGDLNLFIELIAKGDKGGLMDYAMACNDMMLCNHHGIDGNITTITLVQGDALGGGMEAAISAQVLIAERSAKMGLPDILFNLFPGAGAYSLLSRKIGMVEAERLVLSGRLHTAEEMHKLGVVDILAEDGQGQQVVSEYIKKERRLAGGYRAFRRAKQCCNPVSREELLAAAGIWVETAFQLEAKDLRMMERLVKRQSAKIA